MKRLIISLAIVVILISLVFSVGPFFIVEEGEQVVVVRFGQIVNTVPTAGFNFRIPFIDMVYRFPKKILSWDGAPSRVPTLENQFIWIDTTARWRIVDIAQFYASVNTLETAFSRLDDVIESAVRNVIARNLIHEAVRNSNLINELEVDSVTETLNVEDVATDLAADEATQANADDSQSEDAPAQESLFFDRSAVEELANLIVAGEDQEAVLKGRNILSEDMLESVAEVVPDFGIEVIDVVIRQIRYSDDLTESVYDRMVSERNRIAQAYRSYGEGRKQEIFGQLEREKNRVLSEAYEESQRISGIADADAARLYASAYSRSPSFFRFWRATESYRTTLPEFDKIISTDLEYFRYLHSESGQ